MRPTAARTVHIVSAALTGAVLGIGGTAGIALLLYTGQGFLSAAGFLVAVLLLALGSGLWVGAVDEETATSADLTRRRVSWAIAAFLVAAVFAQIWRGWPEFRDLPIGGALAVLLILAEPAYTVGSLLAGIHGLRLRRGSPSTAAAALGGAALGILLASNQLIPRWEAPLLFVAAAFMLAITGILGMGAAREVSAKGGTMSSKVVLITGVGDRGQLGFALAAHFLRKGARVAITARSPRVGSLADELGQFGDIVAEPGDLNSPADASRIVETAVRRFGRLDAVVNAAGGLSVAKPIAETEPDEWRGEIRRNADTALVISRAALPALRESRGAIVHFASPAGIRAAARLGAYSAGKAAVIALTRSLALEEKQHGVRVNAIAPGTVDTEQNRASARDPEKARYVTREEVADVAWFLATDASRGITGQVISVLGETLT